MHGGLSSQLVQGTGLDPKLLPILKDYIADIETIEPHRDLALTGDQTSCVHFLLRGSTVRYLTDSRGCRQITGVGLCGEFLDLDSLQSTNRSYGISSLEQTQVGKIPKDVMIKILRDHPEMMGAFWSITLRDSTYLERWVFRLGLLRAEQRIAHFLCEVIERLSLRGKYDGMRIAVPFRQVEYAEACGITAVHANRCFRNLQSRELVAIEASQNVCVRSEAGLRELGQFKPLDQTTTSRPFG